MQKKLIIGIVLMLASTLHAQVVGDFKQDVVGDFKQDIEVPFDVNEIIEQVSNNASKPQGGNITEWSQGDEFLIDTNFVYAPIGQHCYPNSIAFNGTYYLVVWMGYRNLDADIYVARVDTLGTLLDSVGIIVAAVPSGQQNPAVASDGSDYLVVWQSYQRGNGDIYGARVTTDGTVLDYDGFSICTAAGNQLYPLVEFDGTNYMVVWEDYRAGNYDIYGARIDTSGTVLNEFAICNAAENQMYPVISFNGADYLITWQDYRNGSYHNLYAQRVNTNGGLIGENIAVCVDSASRAYYPSIANDGTNYLIVWYDNRNGPYDIYGARVDSSGTVLDTNGIAISATASYQQRPKVAFDGTNYLVVWYCSVSGSGLSFDIYGVRVDTSGTVLDTTAIEIISLPGQQEDPQLAFDGTNYMVVFQEYRTSRLNVAGVRVDTSGTPLDPNGFLISLAPYTQYRPAVSFDGANYLVVWSDFRDDFTNRNDIYGARVTPSGAILDPNGIAICAVDGKAERPNVASDGLNHLVVWRDHRNGPWPDVYGQLVSAAGALIGDNVAICTTETDQYDINIGYGAGKYLVVWHDRVGWPDFQIYGQLVNTSGQLAGPEIHFTNAPEYKAYPCVAFDGTNFMVVWEDDRSGATSDIYGARVDTSGVVLDTINIPIAASTFLSQYYPWVAFDGTNYLIVYNEYHADADVYGVRVDTSGEVLDTIGIAISDAIGSQYLSRVVFSDTNYVVVWYDTRNELTARYDVGGATVTPSLTVIDSFVISLPQTQTHPILAHGQGDQVLIVYSGWVDSLGGRLAQTMRIWGAFAPVPGIEEMPGVIPTAGLRLQCYPNPFDQTTEIRYEIADNEMQNFSLSIYDVSGRLVKQFDNLSNRPVNTIFWYGKDYLERELPAGVYFAQLKSGRLTRTKKIVKLK